jgi:hypothetical protein
MAPVDPMSLADPEQRRDGQASRGMKVFSFWDSTNTRPTVNVMLAPTANFDELWAEAAVVTIGGIEVRITSIPHLIRALRRHILASVPPRRTPRCPTPAW